MVLARGYINQRDLAADVDRASQALAPHVLRLRYTISDDSVGDPAIYFRVVLADAASRPTVLADVTGEVTRSLFKHLQPYEKWGLTPYFSFRSASEVAKRNDPDWA